ncbi:MAG: TolC family protein [Prevotella sp.]|nr:TolC family protein [Prevotella sp.]
MKKSVITILALFAVASTFGQKKWTLEDCINYAVENNITLQQARLQKQSATETRKQSNAALFPTLSASTNQSVGYRPWTSNGTMTVTNGTVATDVKKTYYNGSYGINASWTVWNGGQNTNQLKRDRLSEQQADLSVLETANSIQEQIARNYVQILYLTEAVEVQRQALETAKKNEERGQVMLEVGKMSKADLAQLTAQRATDEYNIVQAETQVADYMLRLRQLLEITDGRDFDIAIPATTDEQALATIPSLMNVYETALAQRPEIQNAKLDIEQSGLQMKMAKAGHLPTVSMTAGVGTSTNSLSQNTWGSQIKTNFDASAGVGIQIPIIDARKTKTAVNKARIAHEQAELDLVSRQKQLYSDIESCWLEAMSNQQKFRAAKLSVASEQASYDLLSEQFRLGLKNIVELLTGKDKLLQAQQNRLQSKYTTILNQQLLKFYQGETMNL